uniref:Uncharacterized protein n=1 Tax=Tanacetum cinerariifolium TaxID=118510 RepID=A0A699KJD7_TANCI|nr:hypothetical protein [Tanacetum cinerariifolium]
MPEHQSDTFVVFTVTTKILLEPTLNKILVGDVGDSIWIELVTLDVNLGPKWKLSNEFYEKPLEWSLSNLPFAFGGLGVYYAGDIYEDHVVSCVSIVGIKHQHNLVRDTFFNICFWSRILAGKEVDIGLGGGWEMHLVLCLQ